RLPVDETAFNTAALLLSGALLIWAQRVFRNNRRAAKPWLMASIALGAFFVAFQGVEWVGLIREGLTLTSSTHGGFFYLIIGMHGLHAIAALGVLGMSWARLRRGMLAQSTFAAAQAFWYFVVGVWPILYWQIYW
ncbi:MAG: cytochrome c oxidase subunit 3, partial [Deltaproteobacteria bacterium]|nr:cytochrome c oxidase subunit 3 [Deltaproteobacteria bacterium]